MRSAFTLLVLAICMITASPLAAEPCDVGVAGLAELLDQVLPIHVRPLWTTGARKVMTVRYIPVDSSSGESLVTFVERDDRSITITVRRLRQPLLAEVDAMISGEPDLSCATIVQRLTIDEVMIDGAPLVRLQRLYRKLLTTRIRADTSGDIHLDTARYDFVVSGGMESVALTGGRS